MKIEALDRGNDWKRCSRKYKALARVKENSHDNNDDAVIIAPRGEA